MTRFPPHYGIESDEEIDARLEVEDEKGEHEADIEREDN